MGFGLPWGAQYGWGDYPEWFGLLMENFENEKEIFKKEENEKDNQKSQKKMAMPKRLGGR